MLFRSGDLITDDGRFRTRDHSKRVTSGWRIPQVEWGSSAIPLSHSFMRKSAIITIETYLADYKHGLTKTGAVKRFSRKLSELDPMLITGEDRIFNKYMGSLYAEYKK